MGQEQGESILSSQDPLAAEPGSGRPEVVIQSNPGGNAPRPNSMHDELVADWIAGAIFYLGLLIVVTIVVTVALQSMQ
jgi:hypothetical protein